MTLRYRGAEYATPNTNIQFVEEVIGQYRGAVVTRRVPTNVAHQSIDGLTYRGAVVR
jgi:hypothetical protein